MKALVILNGVLESASFLKKLAESADFVICADGGYNHALQAEIVPDLLLGDMDSVAPNDFAGEIMRYPPEKDYTDCELAVETARNHGANEIVLTCALGGRMDHTMANLYLLAKYPNLFVCEPSVTVYAVAGEKVFYGNGNIFSVLPITDAELSIAGAKYPLNRKKYPMGGSLGISNQMTAEKTVVTVHAGKCLLFINDSNKNETFLYTDIEN